MSGESFSEQMRRLKRELARPRATDAPPPGQRPGYMPRTKAVRLEELAEIRRAHGLQDGQPIGSMLTERSPARVEEAPPKPLYIWVVDGVKVQASERPAGGLSLVEAGLGDAALRSGLHR